jgi:hypothetical protein
MYFVLPLWIAAGFADWLSQDGADRVGGRRHRIRHPLLMFAEIGAPLLAALFLEVDALVIAAMIVAFLAHKATALLDVAYASTARAVTPIERSSLADCERPAAASRPPRRSGDAHRCRQLPTKAPTPAAIASVVKG